MREGATGVLPLRSLLRGDKLHAEEMAVEHTHQGGAAALNEGAGVVAGELGGDAWSEGHHAPAIGPWKLAFRRLRRNKTALAFLVLFIVIVAMCLLAPVYAKHVAHIGAECQQRHRHDQSRWQGEGRRVSRRRADRADVHEPLLLRRRHQRP